MLLRSKKKAQYAVLVYCNGNWTTQFTLTDQDVAMKRARDLAQNDRSAEAIRVMEYVDGLGGKRTETELLNIDRPEAHQRQAFQVGNVEAVALCNSVQDVFEVDARRAMEALLRPYLGAQSLTPTEFLHIADYQREIDRYGTLIESGIYRVARLQAKDANQSVEERQATLFEYAEQIQKAAKVFAKQQRELPAFEGGQYDVVKAAIAEKIPAEQQSYYMTAAVCQYLTKYRAMMDKLEQLVLGLIDTDDDGRKILDRIFADAVYSPGVLRDLLGPQVSLIAQIRVCLDVLNGKYRGKTPFGGQCLAMVSGLIGNGGCPETGGAFRGHIGRALASDTPLDRREPEPMMERGKLEQLALDLERQPVMKADWAPIKEAIDRRRRRLSNDLYGQ